MSERGPILDKSVYSPPLPSDGVRVLVTRYWPRGVKKELADVWLKGLGPSPGLIRLWKDGAMGWAEFTQSYMDEFSDDGRRSAFEELKGIVRAARGPVTLLCACPEGERCHRLILKDLLCGGKKAGRP